MNTMVEKFAFWMVVVFALLIPIVWGVVSAAAESAGTDVSGLEVLVVVAMAVFFPILCIICSVWIERNHFKVLAEEEKELADITISDMRTLPPNWKASNPVFVSENVVVANDYLKSLLWFFRKLVGGRSNGYSRLIERARREATVRLLKKVREQGANVVWNVRYDTVVIQFNSNNTIAGVECFAYGTAFVISD